MKKENKCIVCKKKIKKSDTYLKVELYEKGKLKGTDYAHKECHDKTKQLSININGLMPMISKVVSPNLLEGLLKEEKK